MKPTTLLILMLTFSEITKNDVTVHKNCQKWAHNANILLLNSIILIS
jgi:hypothetical protein